MENNEIILGEYLITLVQLRELDYCVRTGDYETATDMFTMFKNNKLARDEEEQRLLELGRIRQEEIEKQKIEKDLE